MKLNYSHTIKACYLGYIDQGIINNISPLLFATYQKSLGIPLDKIGMLIAINFGVQIAVDLASAKYADRLGYRASIILAHILTVLGLVSMFALTRIMDNAFLGLVIATVLNAVGGGLLEVLVSPMVEAAPGGEKEKAMSMLHSFYCWGCVGFILISTLLIRLLGSHTLVLPLIWSVVPAVNIWLFALVPINRLTDDQTRVPLRAVAKQKFFAVAIILMLCAGASEMAMSQWASYFAEMGLKVDKTTGDLLGPCAFSLLMGLSRLFYGRMGDRISLEKFMTLSCALGIFSYLLAALSPAPAASLAGCALGGLAVGILWPGTYSIAAAKCKAGGTALFAVLALAGDIGCVSGPGLVSAVSDAAPDWGLSAGILAATVFPLIMLIAVRTMKRIDK